MCYTENETQSQANHIHTKIRANVLLRQAHKSIIHIHSDFVKYVYVHNLAVATSETIILVVSLLSSS